MATSSASTSLFDAKSIGKPPSFSGEEAHWQDWKFRMESFVGSLDDTMLQEMVTAATAPDEVPLTGMTPETQRRSRQLYYALVMVLSRGALSQIKSSEKHNGFEAYRLLHRRYEVQNAGRYMAMLQQILEYKILAGRQGSDDYMESLLKLEQLCDLYEEQSGNKVDKNLRVAKLLENIDAAVKSHVYLTIGSTDDYTRVRELCLQLHQARRTWQKQSTHSESNKTAANDDMEIDAMTGKHGKGKSNKHGKGGKGSKGKSDKGAKGDGKFAQGKFGKSGKTDQKGGDDKQKCKHCGRNNHDSSKCWWKPTEVAAMAQGQNDQQPPPQQQAQGAKGSTDKGRKDIDAVDIAVSSDGEEDWT
jgi:hypothetical protein